MQSVPTAQSVPPTRPYIDDEHDVIRTPTRCTCSPSNGAHLESQAKHYKFLQLPVLNRKACSSDKQRSRKKSSSLETPPSVCSCSHMSRATMTVARELCDNETGVAMTSQSQSPRPDDTSLLSPTQSQDHSSPGSCADKPTTSDCPPSRPPSIFSRQNSSNLLPPSVVISDHSMVDPEVKCLRAEFCSSSRWQTID